MSANIKKCSGCRQDHLAWQTMNVVGRCREWILLAYV